MAENNKLSDRAPVTIGGMRLLVDELVANNQRLIERIKGLEERHATAEQFKYVGVWRADRSYELGNFATYAGSLWHCNGANVGVKPGSGSEWTLCVKSGERS
jgi:hypothetical protein